MNRRTFLRGVVGLTGAVALAPFAPVAPRLPGRAAGGPILGPSDRYMVGEHGPEWFVPAMPLRILRACAYDGCDWRGTVDERTACRGRSLFDEPEWHAANAEDKAHFVAAHGFPATPPDHWAVLRVLAA